MIGCSKKLSRDEAEKAIKQTKNLPKNEIQEFSFTQTALIRYDVPYKKVLTDMSSKSYDVNYQASIDAGVTPQIQKIQLFEILEKEGLVDYTTEIKDINYGSPYGLGGRDYYISIPVEATVYHNAMPTEKGKKFIIDNHVIVATEEFGEITGIVERKEFNNAEVNYTVKRINITPFGKLIFNLNEETFNRTATFTKYDDGWRIGN